MRTTCIIIITIRCFEKKKNSPTDAAMTAKAHERASETKRAVRSGAWFVDMVVETCETQS